MNLVMRLKKTYSQDFELTTLTSPIPDKSFVRAVKMAALPPILSFN